MTEGEGAEGKVVVEGCCGGGVEGGEAEVGLVECVFEVLL